MTSTSKAVTMIAVYKDFKRSHIYWFLYHVAPPIHCRYKPCRTRGCWGTSARTAGRRTQSCSSPWCSTTSSRCCPSWGRARRMRRGRRNQFFWFTLYFYGYTNVMLKLSQCYYSHDKSSWPHLLQAPWVFPYWSRKVSELLHWHRPLLPWLEPPLW